MFTMPAATYTNPSTFHGMASSVAISGTLPAGYILNGVTNAPTATTSNITGLNMTITSSAVGAGNNGLMVDLDADALGNIKSLRIDGVLAPNGAGQLSQDVILQLDFPNNGALQVGATAPAYQVALKAVIIVL